MKDGVVRPAGDAALRLELPPAMDVATSERVVRIAEALRERHPGRFRDVVVGYHTVTVYFDPLAVDRDWLSGEMRAVAAARSTGRQAATRTIDIPVCYGGEQGPDLADVARAAALSEDEVINRHAGRRYRVFVVGFAPGFAYMGPVDGALTLPRRPVPRTKVPPGSVAIAAGQTGIYPSETPGGWHILGRTPVRPFDPSRAEPVLFQPGDEVRFHPIDAAEYARLATW